MPAPSLLSQIYANVASLMPNTRQAEGQAAALRAFGDGSLSVTSGVPDRNALAAEGALFTASNATIGTAVTYALTTAFLATTPAFYITNNDGANGKNIQLDSLRMITVAVAATVTSVRCAIVIDSTNRAPSAGNVALAPQCCNMAAKGSIASVQSFSGAALTVPASLVTARLIDQATLNQHIPISGDEYYVRFGQTDAAPSTPGTAAAITIAGRYVTDMQGVSIPPGSCALIYLWEPGATTTSPTFEYTLAWRERQ